MLAALLLAIVLMVGAYEADAGGVSGVDFKLVESNDELGRVYPYAGPIPAFVDCRRCQQSLFKRIDGRTLTVNITFASALRLAASDLEAIRITESSEIYDPESRYFTVWLIPRDHSIPEIRTLVEDHYNDLVAVSLGDDIIHLKRVTTSFQRNIEAGIFTRLDDARRVADRIGLHPTVVPFDPKGDERVRREVITAILSDYLDEPTPRRRVEEEHPALFDFLQRNPGYWELMGQPHPALSDDEPHSLRDP